MLKLLRAQYPTIHIIVSDDGSRDRTKEIALNYKHVMFLDRSKEKIKGLTASIVDGIMHTRTHYFIVMDGDLQHPPEKIKEIAKALEAGNEIVVGVRRKVLVPWAWHRKMGSKLMTFFGNMRLRLQGVYSKDILSGYFGMQTKTAQLIIRKHQKTFQMKGYKILFDILKNMNGIKTIDIEYDFGLRSKGESKMSSKVVYHYLKSIVT